MRWKNLAVGTTVFFVTATITEWRPLLAQEHAKDILLEDLEFYRAKYGCRILAYVIMPGHYHLVIELQRPENLAVFAKHANGRSKLAVWKEQARAVGIVSENVLRTKIDYIHNNPAKRGLVAEPGQWPWSITLMTIAAFELTGLRCGNWRHGVAGGFGKPLSRNNAMFRSPGARSTPSRPRRAGPRRNARSGHPLALTQSLKNRTTEKGCQNLLLSRVNNVIIFGLR